MFQIKLLFHVKIRFDKVCGQFYFKYKKYKSFQIKIILTDV